MNAKTRYQVGTGLLFLAIALVVMALLEMTGVMPRYVPSRELTLPAMIIVIAAGALRRGAKKEMAAGTKPPA